jgi:hypothetical protein
MFLKHSTSRKVKFYPIPPSSQIKPYLSLIINIKSSRLKFGRTETAFLASYDLFTKMKWGKRSKESKWLKIFLKILKWMFSNFKRKIMFGI